MKRIFALLLFCWPQLAAGEEANAAADNVRAAFQEKLGELSSETYAVRIEAGGKIMESAKNQPVEFGRLLLEQSRANPDPEIRHQTSRLLRKLFEFEVLGLGANDFGFELGWFVVARGENIFTRPYVREIAKNGAAAKAGMRRGDVIAKLDDQPLQDVDGRARLIRKLAQLPPGKEVVFKISRNPEMQDNDVKPRIKSMTLAVVPESRKPQKDGEAFPEERFAEWIGMLEKP